MLGLPAMVWVILAIGGVAIALFLVRGAVTGTVTGAVYTMQIGDTLGSSGTPSCLTVSNKPANQLEITWTGALNEAPDNRCDVIVDFKAGATNSGPLRLQGFTAPAGLVATFGDATQCGKTWAPDANAGTWVDLTFDGSVSNITFDGNIHGFEFVRSADFNPANCPPVTS